MLPRSSSKYRLKHLPEHIAIIPDGNRRWARKKGIEVLKGHEKGIENIAEILKWCREFGIRNITMWGFSTENRKRTREEIDGLMKLFEIKLAEILKRAEKEKGKKDEYPKVGIRFFGDIGKLPPKLKRYMNELEKRTIGNDEYRINFLLNYGGKDEIIECIKKVAEDYKRGKIGKINEENIRKRMWTGELTNPDLIIRTSGEYRLSGLLPLQSGYSELFFVKKHWPDFSKKDFIKILREYEKRERRFGK